jgi:predicted amidohydrolase
MRIALAAANMTKEVNGRATLLARIRRFAMEASDCSVLILPEYFPMLCLDYAPASIPKTDEIRWLAKELHDMDLEGAIAEIAKAYDIAILAGTWPAVSPNGFRNRAFFITEEGTVHTQDKMSLTMEEKDRLGWYLKPGESLDVFTFMGVKCGISICHDTTKKSEFDAFKKAGVKVVFVPSMCEDEGAPQVVDSHAFIFNHAKTRSKECECYFACVGSVGPQHYLGQTVQNVGGAALYCCGDMVAEIGPISKGRGSSGAMLKVDIDV